jgi:hypothetical protein
MDAKNAQYKWVDRDSICPNTGKGHIPTTREQMIEGNHMKVHTVCRNCGAHIL